MQLFVGNHDIRIFSCFQRSDLVPDSDADCRIDGGCPDGLFLRYAHLHSFSHTVIQIRGTPRNGPVRQRCQWSTNSNILSTQSVLPIFHAYGAHAVTDEDHTVCTEQAEGIPYHTGMDMDTIADLYYLFFAFVLGRLVEQITSRRVIDDRCHVLDTQIVCPGTGQSHVVDDVFSFFIIEITVLQNASLPYIVFSFFRTFLFCLIINSL